MRNTSLGNKKFEEALELLNEAGREKVKEVLEDTKETLQGGEEKIKKTFGEVEEAVQKNPLMALGTAALGALFLGYFLGSSKKDK
ncbi:MAG: hypothetical protein HY592_04245 [Candidatus Omnitrophica bacterium]|nr:hypothetical protein [Candidatus Omnitrophota bacterium]